MIEPNERKTFDSMIHRLTETYTSIPPHQVAEIVHGAYSTFDGRPLREYVPLFVERNAKRELNALSTR